MRNRRLSIAHCTLAMDWEAKRGYTLRKFPEKCSRAPKKSHKMQVTDWETKYREKPAAMMREYGLGAQILRDIGVRKIELLTSSTKHLTGLHTFGIEIVSQVPLDDGSCRE